MVFSLASLAALVVRRTVGLLGFSEPTWTDASVRATAAEVGAIVAVAVLLVAFLAPAGGNGRTARAGHPEQPKAVAVRRSCCRTLSAVLTALGRAIRLAGTLAVLGVLVAGTVAGSDDHFPFGPFSMYSSAHDPNAGVASNHVEAVLDDGRVLAVSDGDTGMRRAEIEGQLPRFIEDPRLLELLAVAHERRRPDAPRYAAVRVVQRWYQLRDGQPVGNVTEDVVAEWVRP